MFIRMFTFITAIDDRSLFRRIGIYHVQETSLIMLLLLVLQKTRVSVFLEEMKF